MRLRAALVAVLLAAAGTLSAAPIRVRHREGVIHGFLSLRTTDGKVIGTGDALQTTRGDTVTSKLLLRLDDGSTSEETTVFTQGRVFRLVSERIVQKGPSFPIPIDMSIDGKTGVVNVRYTKDGEEKTESERLDPLPDDLANGLVGIVMKNVPFDVKETRLSLVVATPKPRLVKLVITPNGKEPFVIGRRTRKVLRWLIKIEIGGVAGVVAPLVGKDPPDSSLWMLGGESPSFLMSESPLALDGPALRMELVGPFWPSSRGAATARR
jgi:hypothetical protein